MAELDWNALSARFFNAIEDREQNQSAVHFPPIAGTPYTSKDAEDYRYKSGEVTSDVGLIDPLDLWIALMTMGGTAARPRPPRPARPPRARIGRAGLDLEHDVSKDVGTLGDYLYGGKPVPGSKGVAGPATPDEAAAEAWIDDMLRQIGEGRTAAPEFPPSIPKPPASDVPPTHIPLSRPGQQPDVPPPWGQNNRIGEAMEQIRFYQQQLHDADDPSLLPNSQRQLDFWIKVLKDYLRDSGGRFDGPPGGYP